MSTTPTIVEFRAVFPEFANATTYPDAQLTYWLGIALQMLNVDRWGDLLSHGAYLLVAHNVSQAATRAASMSLGGVVNAAGSKVTSKSVDKVSMSYDVTSSAEEGAGNWNMTTYGQQYIRQARLMGAGPVHVGTPEQSVANNSAAAYPGPYFPY